MSWCRHDPFLVYLDNNLKPDLICPIQRGRDVSFKENCEETIVTLSKCRCPHSYTSKHYLFVSQMCSGKSALVFHKIWYDIFMYVCDMNLIEFIYLYWCIHLGVYIYVIIHIYNITYIYMIIWFHIYIYIYTKDNTTPFSPEERPLQQFPATLVAWKIWRGEPFNVENGLPQKKGPEATN